MVVELSPVSGMGAIWERNRKQAEVLEKLIHQRDNQVVGIGLQVGSGTADLPPSRGWVDAVWGHGARVKLCSVAFVTA